MEEEQRIDVGQEGELVDNVIYQDATEICCNTDKKKLVVSVFEPFFRSNDDRKETFCHISYISCRPLRHIFCFFARMKNSISAAETIEGLRRKKVDKMPFFLRHLSLRGINICLSIESEFDALTREQFRWLISKTSHDLMVHFKNMRISTSRTRDASVQQHSASYHVIFSFISEQHSKSQLKFKNT